MTVLLPWLLANFRWSRYIMVGDASSRRRWQLITVLEGPASFSNEEVLIGERIRSIHGK